MKRLFLLISLLVLSLGAACNVIPQLSLIHISEPTRPY
jgi:hypothetical protein